MAEILAPYFAKQSLARLGLSDTLRQHVEKLLELAEDDHRVNVARIHQALFPLNAPASANASLNRLLNSVNEAADRAGIVFSAKITADKKGGAVKRWVWFEGPLAVPAPAYTSELNGIPSGQLLDARGLPEEMSPVVVLLTFNTNESAAVIREFHPQGTPATQTLDGTTYNLLGLHGDMRIVHRVSKQGECEAQNATHDAIKDWYPRAIIGVGIAFGVNALKQAIGDVLVSENVRGYELGRVNADGTLTPRGDKPPASSILFQRFNHLHHARLAEANACTHWPTLRLGTLLSGNKLVDNLDYRNALLALEAEALGGEMEAVGIQLAADRHKADWIIVKAICDWADGGKNNKRKEADQRLAAANAALVVHQALALGNLYGERPAPSARVHGANTPGLSRPGQDSPHIRQFNLRDMEAISCLIEDPRGKLASLRKDEPQTASPEDAGVDVMDYLLRWIDEPGASRLFALLGEYGMGKTVTCQRLARRLADMHQADPGRPVPLYFDLRHVTGLDRRVPTLRETLEECMERGWTLDGARQPYMLENVFRWAEQGAVVIFDGLDEVLVKLKEADGQVFTDNLLKLAVDVAARRRAQGLNTPPLKLLISCRTQYFRTLRDQQNHFTGQERGETKADHYRALVLLPLTEAQVRGYLHAALPGADPERLMETLRSVHNLEELSQRPYTLRLVSEFIPEIEQERLAGKTVYGVTLYRRMAQRWLERDAGKHHIRPEHKMHLAAHLAAHLWQAGGGLLPAEDIERWFHAWLESEPDLLRRYRALHPDQLEEDLRTATFLARVDGEQGGGFRFAHTSLMEFFLAGYLLQALRANDPECWSMKTPSRETLDFLGQMLAEADEPALVRTLSAWARNYRPRASELLLAYAFRARRSGWPAPTLRGLDMRGADLQDWVFDTGAGAEGAPTLDLGGADFSGACLRRSVFDGVGLKGANFRAALLAQASFLDCDATGADWRDAESTATVWRHCDLAGGRWHGVRGARPAFLGCVGIPSTAEDRDQGAAFPPGLSNVQAVTQKELLLRDISPPINIRLDRLAGHAGIVFACAWSPDGRRIASAGVDGTIRLWEAASGTVFHTINCPEGGVWSVDWSMDGRRLAGAGEGGTVRVWEAASGAVLHTLEGYGAGVATCNWSLDGRQLAIAGDGGKVQVWGMDSGTIVLTLEGIEGGMSSCAWSPDGTQLATAGGGGAVRIRDAVSGAVLLTLEGHGDSVYACSYSPDGTQLAGAGSDDKVWVWQLNSGAVLHAMEGHSGGVWAVEWSPDGTRLASVGGDGAVRVWDAASGLVLLALEGLGEGAFACEWSPDGSQLIGAGEDGTVWIWEVAGGTAQLRLKGQENEVYACDWSPDGTRLASASADGAVRVWDAANGSALVTLQGHVGKVNDCAWSPDGTKLASAGANGTVMVWDVAGDSGFILLVLEGHGRAVRACAWSPDGKRLASAGADGAVRVWDVVTGTALLTLEGLGAGVYACAWSPDGARLASAGENGTLCVWEAVNGAVLLSLDDHGGWVFACAWSPDGSRLASASADGAVRVWDAASGSILLALDGIGRVVRDCVWSPDGTRLASATTNGTVRVWDAASGALLFSLEGLEGANACVWSPNGMQLASAGDDGTLRVWDVTTSKLLRIHALSNPDHRGEVGHAVWEPEGNRIIEAQGNIWRELAWVRTGADGWPEHLPLEAFGPLPPPRKLAGRALDSRHRPSP